MAKQKKRFVGPHITHSVHNFYLVHFGSVRAGATYVLEAFPRLFEESLTEARSSLKKATFERMIKRLSQIELSKMSYNGTMILDLATEKEAEKIIQLPRFTRICMELEAMTSGEHPPPIPLPGKAEHELIPLTPKLGKDTFAFYKERFPSVFQGSTFVLNRFPSWLQDVMVLDEAKRLRPVINGVILDNPLAAGNHLLPVNRVVGGKSGFDLQSEFRRLPLFTRACLEIDVSPKLKSERKDVSGKKGVTTTKVISPKIRVETLIGLGDVFGTPNPGVTFATEVFLPLYYAGLAKVGEVFTENELLWLKETMGDCLPGEGYGAGQVLPVLAQRRFDEEPDAFQRDILRKFENLGACERMCLELWAHYIQDIDVIPRP